VLAAGVGALVASDAVAEVEALDEAVLQQQLEHPVDARAAGAVAAPSQPSLDLERAERARFAVEQVDHEVARAAAAIAGRGEHRASVIAPARPSGNETHYQTNDSLLPGECEHDLRSPGCGRPDRRL